ncbi:MAG TPA: bacterial transcriptional activator domain-containing protein, partial [Burkholderiales bacterium]
LGRFELVRDGVPVKSGGKAQQRVLDLLKAIVAFGPRGAASDTIASALWPASDGDAAQTALDVTLHRLRKLLGLEGAVVVADGRIALNPRCCWVDAFAFEQALDACERDGGELAEAERALGLYAGHFLQGDEETPWLLPRRERLRSKFLRCVERCGATREERGEHPAAVELYRRALEVDPLAEGVYRNLMAAYLAAGRRAEALEAYRRCRHMLSVVLGVPPSAETEAMRARVSANR